jgi:DNA-binding winged helix-turn-helix (wHTH) protein
MDCYLFDKFRLIPDDFRLIDERTSQPISEAKGKCFDLLVTFVKNPARVMGREEILNKTWGDAHVTPGNVDTHVHTLRQLLGDPESSPRIIQTVPRRGYRFIATVTKTTLDHGAGFSRQDSTPSGHTFEVESHRFVPTYVGIPANVGIERHTMWGGYREIDFKDARLCVTSYGIGVWHVRDIMRFSSLTELAHWRRREFHAILEGDHPIASHTANLLSKKRAPTHEILERSKGGLVYVLSVFAVKHHAWTNKQLRTALKLLSCPRELFPGEQASYDSSLARAKELEMLEAGFEHQDSREFGVYGTDFGYATWAGVSYHGFSTKRSPFVETIADFEIALQSIWLFCHLIHEAAKHATANEMPGLRSAALTIQSEVRRIKAIGATDRTEIRMMCEAILATSRLEDRVNAVLEEIAACVK